MGKEVTHFHPTWWASDASINGSTVVLCGKTDPTCYLPVGYQTCPRWLAINRPTLLYPLCPECIDAMDPIQRLHYTEL